MLTIVVLLMAMGFAQLVLGYWAGKSLAKLEAKVPSQAVHGGIGR